MSIDVINIALVNGRAFITFTNDSRTCAHAWEPHIWEHGRAYCPRCGSFAEWPGDPRLAAAESEGR